ncbi:MAG TPA: hypothetical protein VIZ66_02070 [Sphingomicrobium sp.]
MLLSILALAFGAAAPAAIASAPVPVPAVSRHVRRLFVSPMGEPFTAQRGGDALADWFRQADRNRDGMIVRDEMQKDAERFFEMLDVNHDGEIDPDEITRYETQIAPQNRRALGLLALSEPVAAADSNFNRGVSLVEFQAAADKRFGALDVTKRSMLTLDVLEVLRPDISPRERRDFDRPVMDPNADSGG